MKKLRFSIIIVAIFLVFYFLPVFNRPKAAISHSLLWVASGGRVVAVKLSAYGQAIFFSGKIIKENKDLKYKLDVALANEANFAQTKEENDSLRNLLNFQKRNDLKLIAANVVGIDPSVASHAIVIDRGNEAGIGMGDAVVFSGGIMVGKVVTVMAGRSTVLLTVDPKCVVAALVAGHPGANGAAVGDRGLVIKLSLIPHDADFSVGDAVVTSGGETSVPGGLILGAVDSVSRAASEPFSSATVIPAYDQNDLSAVAVVHKK
jgi:rod shape-determining protein MreC